MEWYAMVWSVTAWYDGSKRIKSDNQPKQLGQTTFFWLPNGSIEIVLSSKYIAAIPCIDYHLYTTPMFLYRTIEPPLDQGMQEYSGA